jgi:RNA polymerase sigma-70 factor (ECF subfamily)
MHDTDAELMRRANRGDRAAFAEIVSRYQSALRRVAESRLGTVEAAEDVVQETLFAAYKSRHTYDPQFGFSTWLWTILLNQCRRYAGRQARHGRAISIDGREPGDASQRSREPIAPDDAGLGGLMAYERREVLERLLLQLSAVQADALRLRFFGGLKFQEIADTMQCTLLTAKNRVRWGLLRLSELVQEATAGERRTRKLSDDTAFDTLDS